MPKSPDLEWLQRAANDLNSLLLQVSGYARRSYSLSRTQPELQRYLEYLEDSVVRASQLTRSMLEKLERMERTSDHGPQGFGVSSPMDLADNSGDEAFGSADEPPSARACELAALAELARQNDVQIANITGNRELILLVDDEAHVCLLAKLMLCDEGYKVTTAYDGEEAVRVFQSIGSYVSLVILDFIMPGIDGESVFNELRKINPDVSVVLSSGFAEQSKLNRMLAHGLCGFIAKPYSQQRLLDQVRFILDAIQNSTRTPQVPDAVHRTPSYP